MQPELRRILAWAFYDWANSAYATVVLAGFFPLFFKPYWASGLAPTESTFWLGAANSGSSLLIVLLAPLVGGYLKRQAQSTFSSAVTRGVQSRRRARVTSRRG